MSMLFENCGDVDELENVKMLMYSSDTVADPKTHRQYLFSIEGNWQKDHGPICVKVRLTAYAVGGSQFEPAFDYTTTIIGDPNLSAQY